MTQAETLSTSRRTVMLSWTSDDAARVESVRVQLGPRGVKASGGIVAAETSAHPAFSSSYDLVVDDEGVTRRLSLRTTTLSGEHEMALKRDTEGFWLVDDGRGAQRLSYGGAVDVDVALSPLFNTIAVRRLSMSTVDVDLDLPVVYVALPELTVTGETEHYRSVAGQITSTTPRGEVELTVDPEGFVLDYPGLARRR
ncbi:MAG: putative glycolipid-binding domain-containing protein [Mycobacteriaceae bacterium]